MQWKTLIWDDMMGVLANAAIWQSWLSSEMVCRDDDHKEFPTPAFLVRGSSVASKPAGLERLA